MRTSTNAFRSSLKRNTRQRLLDLLLARLGWKQAAQRLAVDAWMVDSWLSGTSRMPDDKLSALVDLLDETGD